MLSHFYSFEFNGLFMASADELRFWKWFFELQILKFETDDRNARKKATKTWKETEGGIDKNVEWLGCIEDSKKVQPIKPNLKWG